MQFFHDFTFQSINHEIPGLATQKSGKVLQVPLPFWTNPTEQSKEM